MPQLQTPLVIVTPSRVAKMLVHRPEVTYLQPEALAHLAPQVGHLQRVGLLCRVPELDRPAEHGLSAGTLDI